MLIPICILFILLTLLFIEMFSINRSVGRIFYRVHVNGTRGKSSVTQYIYAGLQTEKPTMGKITGEIPTIFLPDGEEKIIERRSSARVQEQFSIIKKAHKIDAEALVMECMSIDSQLQQLESRFFKPHFYIITNIKDDHREKMGDTPLEQVKSICSAIPKNCKVISGDNEWRNLIKKYTEAKNSEFIELEKLSLDEQKNLPNSIFAINIQLALTVCVNIGVNRDNALKAIVDRALLKKSPLMPINQEKWFLNAFPVNDIPSLDTFLQRWTNKIKINSQWVIIFNTRMDRPTRTDLFANWIITNKSKISEVILLGDHIIRAKKQLQKLNITITEPLINDNEESLIDKLKELSNKLYIGVGNIKGIGFRIIDKVSSKNSEIRGAKKFKPCRYNS